MWTADSRLGRGRFGRVHSYLFSELQSLRFLFEPESLACLLLLVSFHKWPVLWSRKKLFERSFLLVQKPSPYRCDIRSEQWGTSRTITPLAPAVALGLRHRLSRQIRMTRTDGPGRICLGALIVRSTYPGALLTLEKNSMTAAQCVTRQQGSWPEGIRRTRPVQA